MCLVISGCTPPRPQRFLGTRTAAVSRPRTTQAGAPSIAHDTPQPHIAQHARSRAPTSPPARTAPPPPAHFLSFSSSFLTSSYSAFCSPPLPPSPPSAAPAFLYMASPIFMLDCLSFSTGLERLGRDGLVVLGLLDRLDVRLDGVLVLLRHLVLVLEERLLGLVDGRVG